MLIECNHTHRYTAQLEELTQDEIALVPMMDGVTGVEVIERAPRLAAVLSDLPRQREPRAHTWYYVRPQLCRRREPDRRSGSFWHIDVDAVYRSVAPDWDDFRAMAVSFGDVAETEFIEDRFSIEVDGPPRSSDYVTFSPLVNNGQQWRTSSPKPGQVAEYTIRDFHRAGPIRRDGWRLIVLVFETNATPVEKWPPPVAPRY